MDIFLQQLFSGLATGGIYACFAIGLVMIYKSSRIINFAQGDMAVGGTYLAFWMMNIGFHYWTAFAAAVAASFVVGILIQQFFKKILFNQTTSISANMATIGLGLIFQSLAGWLFSYDVQTFPSPFPEGVATIGPVPLNYHDIGMAVVTIVLMLAIMVFFRWTKLGLAMRAVSQNLGSSRAVGIRANWTFSLSWGISSALGTIAAMMISPNLFLSPTMMSMVIIYAYAGAIIGGLETPLGAVIGSIIIGVFENLAGTYLPFVGSQLKMSATLVLMLIFLLVFPEGLFGRKTLRKV